jgi:hypothetical protein
MPIFIYFAKFIPNWLALLAVVIFFILTIVSMIKDRMGLFCLSCFIMAAFLLVYIAPMVK